MTDPSFYTVFSFSDSHIGTKDSLLTPAFLLTTGQRKRSRIKDGVMRDNVIAGIEKNIENADVIVLNGDIMDRMKGFQPEHQDKVMDYVFSTLERWATDYPEKTFYYVMGNHESVDPVIDADIQEWIQYEKNLPNLHFTDKGVIVGDVLFMHGDTAIYGFHQSSRHFANKPSHICKIPEEQKEENINLYNALREKLQGLKFDECIVLVHGGEPVKLTTEMLDNLHVVFGHTHYPEDIELPNGKHLINSGYFKYNLKSDWFQNKTPADLQQLVLTIEDGKMIEPSKRAFPEIENWTGIISAMQQEQENKGEISR